MSYDFKSKVWTIYDVINTFYTFHLIVITLYGGVFIAPLSTPHPPNKNYICHCLS